jgi:hypothetical protein
MRFSKGTMMHHIVKQLADLEQRWGFDPQDGYNQVKDSDLQRILAYGEYIALENMWDDIEYNNIGEEL